MKKICILYKMTGDHDIHFIIASCLICVTTVIDVTLSSNNFYLTKKQGLIYLVNLHMFKHFLHLFT